MSRIADSHGYRAVGLVCFMAVLPASAGWLRGKRHGRAAGR
jgi:hypothetical protein